MGTAVLAALLVVANIMGAGMIVPQVVRLHRVRSADGLSGVWIGVGLSINCWWSAYGLAESLWGILPVSTVAAALYVVMAAQYLGLVGPFGTRPLLLGAGGVALAPLPFLIIGGWPTAGLVVGLTYAVQFAPAAVTAVRESDLSGVSPTTWVMASIEAAIWVIYGVVTDDRALMIGGTGGTIAASVILLQVARFRASRKRRMGPPPGLSARGDQ